MLSNQLSTTKLKPIMSAKIMNALAAKYGFDVKEAQDFLIEEGLKKAPKKREASTKAEKSVAKKVSKKANKKASNDEKPKTKRGLSGYNLYQREERATVVAELQESGNDFKSKEVMSLLGPRWKALSDDERKVWNDKAKVLKEAASATETETDTETEEEEKE